MFYPYLAVTPISRKKRVNRLLLADYGLILAFYFLLAFTGIFAFKELNDLYTLNFQVTDTYLKLETFDALMSANSISAQGRRTELSPYRPLFSQFVSGVHTLHKLPHHCNYAQKQS